MCVSNVNGPFTKTIFKTVLRFRTNSQNKMNWISLFVHRCRARMSYHSNGNANSKQLDTLFLINSSRSRPIGLKTSI